MPKFSKGEVREYIPNPPGKFIRVKDSHPDEDTEHLKAELGKRYFEPDFFFFL